MTLPAPASVNTYRAESSAVCTTSSRANGAQRVSMIAALSSFSSNCISVLSGGASFSRPGSNAIRSAAWLATSSTTRAAVAPAAHPRADRPAAVQARIIPTSPATMPSAITTSSAPSQRSAPNTATSPTAPPSRSAAYSTPPASAKRAKIAELRKPIATNGSSAAASATPVRRAERSCESTTAAPTSRIASSTAAAARSPHATSPLRSAQAATAAPMLRPATALDTIR